MWLWKTPDLAASVGEGVAAPDGLAARVAELAHRVSVPCVRIGLGGLAADSTASYATGFPYLPAEAEWPVLGGGPAAFVCQVNFAEVPRLDGFPTSGLLQWFAAADDTFGLTFDESQGAVGFAVRWFTDTEAPSQQPPIGGGSGDPGPGPAPLGCPPASTLTFTPGRCLPQWAALGPALRDQPIWRELAAAVGQRDADPEQLWDEYLLGPSSPVPQLGPGSKIGGCPIFRQGDPRGRAAYPAANRPGGRLVLELDSAQVGGWGDGGAGQLFGDPARLAAGDTSTLRYHWDCA